MVINWCRIEYMQLFFHYSLIFWDWSMVKIEWILFVRRVLSREGMQNWWPLENYEPLKISPIDHNSQKGHFKINLECENTGSLNRFLSLRKSAVVQETIISMGPMWDNHLVDCPLYVINGSHTLYYLPKLSNHNFTNTLKQDIEYIYRCVSVCLFLF